MRTGLKSSKNNKTSSKNCFKAFLLFIVSLLLYKSDNNGKYDEGTTV